MIEFAGSATGKAHLIKSRHNGGGLPEHMKVKLLEPLRELFKDEVRRLGTELGLPREMVYRHPFPGPGPGVRILGEVSKQYAELLRKADKIFIEELRAHGLYEQVSQAFAVFLPVRSVAVMGDGRRYDWCTSCRSVSVRCMKKRSTPVRACVESRRRTRYRNSALRRFGQEARGLGVEPSQHPDYPECRRSDSPVELIAQRIFVPSEPQHLVAVPLQ